MIASVFCFLNVGGGELVVIVLAILLLFGSKQLPEIARMLGKTIREFRNAMDGVKNEITQTMNEVTPEIKNPRDFIKNEINDLKSSDAPKKEEKKD